MNCNVMGINNSKSRQLIYMSMSHGPGRRVRGVIWSISSEFPMHKKYSSCYFGPRLELEEEDDFCDTTRINIPRVLKLSSAPSSPF